SLSNTEILNLGTQVLQMGSSNLEQARFPRDEYSENALINKIFYLTYDEEIAKNEIYQYIFNDNKLWQTP
ncbi:MAG: LytR family transcriptional regulator, partial [Clostridium sp.]